ncbi:MAG: radical SAM protein [Planctomycetota bacterium]|nr:radical SAM protein [Planctomycetota bacterium]
MTLSIHDHDRRKSGLTYVYAVLSRRAGGVSVGVNLNTNSACNWRCVYCEIPDLTFGNAPECDMALLERELRSMLDGILRGDWMQKNVPEERWRALKDVAISGNGEPTSCPQFAAVVELIGRMLEEYGQRDKVQIVLITNGSLIHKPDVRRGLEELHRIGGVVWFKLDSATDAGTARMNNAHAGMARARANLVLAATTCTTWIQTMALARDAAPPSSTETDAYVEFARSLVEEGVPVKGVLLYGMARPSFQPEAPALSALSREWMEAFAKRIEDAGLAVRLSV